jgi:predicted methyltransferase
MKVLDMGAGAGYSTELVARVIGPTGIVYGQNPPDNFERARNALAARAATPAMRNSMAVVRPYDDPVPADVQALDMITFLFFYHRNLGAGDVGGNRQRKAPPPVVKARSGGYVVWTFG